VLAAAVLASACTKQPPRPRAASEPGDPLAAEALMRDIEWLTAKELAGRGSYQEGGRAAADRVARELERAGLEVVRQPIPGGAENVYGVLRAGPEAVIVSAHYDHLGRDEQGVIYPGADDNASGVAVLLALARVAAAKQHQRTLIFAAFGAEEVGLVGAAVYLDEPIVAIEDTVAVINFDMVGRRFFEAGSGKDATAAVVGLEHDEAARRATHRAAREAGLELVEAPASLSKIFGFHDRTDDWRFRRVDIFAVHFSTGIHDDYHRPTDTADKLVPEQMERIARTAYGLLTHLTEAPAQGRNSYDSE
jgi:hypothetical protein